MPNLLLKIRYKGTNYHGWQVQKNALSVQEVLQNSIEKLYGSRLDVKGCSRTDTGVHANMYCVSFNAPFYAGDYHTISALNTFLPPDIRVYDCKEVDDAFHARYSSLGKEYVYLVHNATYQNPFYSDYSYHFRYDVDIDLINKAAKHFIGTHDFAAFCSAYSDSEDTVRTIYGLKAERDGELIRFTISGNGFLYNMVRIIVGTLLMVSQGKISPDDIPEIINSKQRKNAGRTAPPQGLFLNKVFYDEVLY